MENKRTLEQIDIDIKNLKEKVVMTNANLHYLNTEIRLLESERDLLMTKIKNESMFGDVPTIPFDLILGGKK